MQLPSAHTLTSTLKEAFANSLASPSTFQVIFPENSGIRQMEYKEDKDFYHSLPKKELQDLCKRYGLYPYTTKFNLVNSLYSYLKENNLRSISPSGDSAVHSTSVMPILKSRPESENMVHDPKDTYANSNFPWEKYNRMSNSETVRCNKQGSSKEAGSCSKAPGVKVVQGSENFSFDIPQDSGLNKKKEATCSQNEVGNSANDFGHRMNFLSTSFDDNNLSCPREVGLNHANQVCCGSPNRGAYLTEIGSSFVKSSKGIPSYEYHVSSEDGIDLFVDLNSSPSDLPKRLFKMVSGGPSSMPDENFGSLREELFGSSSKEIKNSSLCNTDSEHKMSSGHEEAGFLPCPINKQSGLVVVDNTCGVDGLEMSPQLDETEKFPLLSPKSGVETYVISGTESCPMDRGRVPIELCVIDNPQVKSSSNSVVNSTPECPKSFNSQIHQNTVVGDENSNDLTLQNTSNYVSSSLVYPGWSSSGSMEIPSSEVVSQQKDELYSRCTNGCMDVIDPMVHVEAIEDELANSSTCQDYRSSCANEWERSKLTNDKETSESFQSNKSLGKMPENAGADKVPNKKRRHSAIQDRNCCSECNAMNLRSRTRQSEIIRPRRSMRLVSKVLVHL
ncbi:uncharacterized protein LOC127811919 isoform X3 [Diospyros lotus]|uniref:uncharacterized protein LOC127811919 isoform X3 n=1 Tax=Diospyros lotus TaxID=55363 RepID=UPI002258EA05|nr:uncharacterized protein LOC127811919 isoform X3 [Diospyros lotus]